MSEVNSINLLTGPDLKLFVGQPGTGKTIAGASYADTHILVSDGRIRSVKAFYPDRKDISWDEFGPYDYANYRSKLGSYVKTGFPKKTLVVDVTSFGNMCLQHMLNERTAGKKILDVEMLGPDVISFETRAVADFIDLLRLIHKQGVNVIVTAHEIVTTQTNIITGERIVNRTLVTAGLKVAEIIQLFFDEVYRFYIDGEHYKMSSRSQGGNFGKTALFKVSNPLTWTGQNFYDLYIKEAKKAGY